MRNLAAIIISFIFISGCAHYNFQVPENTTVKSAPFSGLPLLSSVKVIKKKGGGFFHVNICSSKPFDIIYRLDNNTFFGEIIKDKDNKEFCYKLKIEQDSTFDETTVELVLKESIVVFSTHETNSL